MATIILKKKQESEALGKPRSGSMRCNVFASTENVSNKLPLGDWQKLKLVVTTPRKTAPRKT